MPVLINQFATPYLQKDRLKADLALFVQDQWTIKRLTLNAGLRFEYFNGYVPAQRQPAGQFVPERDLPSVDCVPCWTDLNPRLGVSYDLFGNGRTAMKVTVGRYLGVHSIDITSVNKRERGAPLNAEHAETIFNADHAKHAEDLPGRPPRAWRAPR